MIILLLQFAIGAALPGITLNDEQVYSRITCEDLTKETSEIDQLEANLIGIQLTHDKYQIIAQTYNQGRQIRFHNVKTKFLLMVEPQSDEFLQIVANLCHLKQKQQPISETVQIIQEPEPVSALQQSQQQNPIENNTLLNQLNIVDLNTMNQNETQQQFNLQDFDTMKFLSQQENLFSHEYLQQKQYLQTQPIVQQSLSENHLQTELENTKLDLGLYNLSTNDMYDNPSLSNELDQLIQLEIEKQPDPIDIQPDIQPLIEEQPVLIQRSVLIDFPDLDPLNGQEKPSKVNTILIQRLGFGQRRRTDDFYVPRPHRYSGRHNHYHLPIRRTEYTHHRQHYNYEPMRHHHHYTYDDELYDMQVEERHHMVRHKQQPQTHYFNELAYDDNKIPQNLESYQGDDSNNNKFQVINRNMNDPNVFSPFDETKQPQIAPPKHHKNQPYENCFEVFDQCNFQGKRLQLCGNYPQQESVGFQIYSYRIPAHRWARFYRNIQNPVEAQIARGTVECTNEPYELFPQDY